MIEAKLSERVGSSIGRSIMLSAARHGVANRFRSCSEGSSCTALLSDGDYVLKVINAHDQIHPPLTSRYILSPLHSRTVTDGSDTAEVTIHLKLNDHALAPIHTEMLRYRLWLEGRDFWDHLPSPIAPKQVKNVMLTKEGVPYVIDHDAVKTDLSYDGKLRTDQDYLEYRANSWNIDGRPDSLSPARFQQIKAACDAVEWPKKQHNLAYHQRVPLFMMLRDSVDSICPPTLDRKPYGFRDKSAGAPPFQWSAFLGARSTGRTFSSK